MMEDINKEDQEINCISEYVYSNPCESEGDDS